MHGSLPPDQRRQQFAMQQQQQQVVLVQSISLYLISYCLRTRAFDCVVLLIIPAVLCPSVAELKPENQSGEFFPGAELNPSLAA